MALTKQALNSINLYRGGNPDTIKQLLKMQEQSVVDELMVYFKADSYDELAHKLSIG